MEGGRERRGEGRERWKGDETGDSDAFVTREKRCGTIQGPLRSYFT